MSNILVVCAHPDDEVLGCGATLKKHADNGDVISVLVLTNGTDVRYHPEMRGTLQDNCRASGTVVGIQNFFFEDFPEQKLDNVPLLDMVKKIEEILEKVKPEIIYTNHKGDINQDHRAVFQAVQIAARPINETVKEIYSFELPSSTEWATPFEETAFIPNVFVGIDKEIDKKIEAFSHYQSEIREWPHSRSLEGIRVLAQYRGMQSHQPYAEAFMLIRKVTS